MISGNAASVAGFWHALMIIFAVQGVDRLKDATIAAWCNRAVRPTLVTFALLAAAHYLLQGYDHGFLAVAGYCMAASMYVVTRPQIENEPLSRNPRELDEVLSRASSTWLYWLTTPALLMSCILVISTASAMT